MAGRSPFFVLPEIALPRGADRIHFMLAPTFVMLTLGTTFCPFGFSLSGAHVCGSHRFGTGTGHPCRRTLETLNSSDPRQSYFLVHSCIAISRHDLPSLRARAVHCIFPPSHTASGGGSLTVTLLRRQPYPAELVGYRCHNGRFGVASGNTTQELVIVLHDNDAQVYTTYLPSWPILCPSELFRGRRRSPLLRSVRPLLHHQSSDMAISRRQPGTKIRGI